MQEILAFVPSPDTMVNKASNHASIHSMHLQLERYLHQQVIIVNSHRKLFLLFVSDWRKQWIAPFAVSAGTSLRSLQNRGEMSKSMKAITSSTSPATFLCQLQKIGNVERPSVPILVGENHLFEETTAILWTNLLRCDWLLQ